MVGAMRWWRRKAPSHMRHRYHLKTVHMSGFWCYIAQVKLGIMASSVLPGRSADGHSYLGALSYKVITVSGAPSQ